MAEIMNRGRYSIPTPSMKGAGIEGGATGVLIGEKENHGNARDIRCFRGIRSRSHRRQAGGQEDAGRNGRLPRQPESQNRLPSAFRTAFRETS